MQGAPKPEGAEKVDFVKAGRQPSVGRHPGVGIASPEVMKLLADALLSNWGTVEEDHETNALTNKHRKEFETALAAAGALIKLPSLSKLEQLISGRLLVYTGRGVSVQLGSETSSSFHIFRRGKLVPIHVLAKLLRSLDKDFRDAVFDRLHAPWVPFDYNPKVMLNDQESRMGLIIDVIVNCLPLLKGTTKLDLDSLATAQPPFYPIYTATVKALLDRGGHSTETEGRGLLLLQYKFVSAISRALSAKQALLLDLAEEFNHVLADRLYPITFIIRDAMTDSSLFKGASNLLGVYQDFENTVVMTSQKCRLTNPRSVIKFLCTLFHEVRHAEQFAWMLAFGLHAKGIDTEFVVAQPGMEFVENPNVPAKYQPKPTVSYHTVPGSPPTLLPRVVFSGRDIQKMTGYLVSEQAKNIPGFDAHLHWLGTEHWIPQTAVLAEPRSSYEAFAALTYLHHKLLVCGVWFPRQGETVSAATLEAMTNSAMSVFSSKWPDLVLQAALHQILARAKTERWRRGAKGENADLETIAVEVAGEQDLVKVASVKKALQNEKAYVAYRHTFPSEADAFASENRFHAILNQRFGFEENDSIQDLFIGL